jgi:hypothetical protein
MAAARRKGKWGGGLPVLGYDVDASSKKLIINEEEAAAPASVRHDSIAPFWFDGRVRRLPTR